jgi:glycosyltransferase involved in cell wall biosynthesis
MRLRVLSVSFPFAPVSDETAGGAEQVLATIDQTLVAGGHDSLVLAARGSRCRGTLIEGPAVPQRIDSEGRNRVHQVYRAMLRDIVQSREIDVIHLHGVDFLDYLPAAGPPVVATLHLPPHLYPQEAFRLKPPAAQLVCVSRTQAGACPGGSSVRVIENGVSLQRFYPAEGKEDYVVALGRICPEKGFDIALDAASAAGVPLWLAGEVFGYDAHERYFRDAIQPRLKNGHRFVGALGGEAKRRLLARARALLAPSLAPETSSLAAMEALACGTPVIAFRSGALPEVVEPGRTGFLVDSREQMAEAIARAGELKYSECRRRAEERFSAGKMCQRYLELYRSMESTTSVHSDGV